MIDHMANKSLSFAITVRPLNGLSSETEKRIVSWLSKIPLGIAVIEMDGLPGRHLHAQIWLKDSRTKSSIKTTLQRICKATIADWTPCQERVLNQGVKFAYNDTFYQEYLLDNPDKPEPVKIIYDNVPSDRQDYYPTIEQQVQWKSRAAAVDKKFHHYVELWREYAMKHGYPAPSPKHWMVHDFYNDALYGSKTICIVKDDKTIRQNIKHLLRYITGRGLALSEHQLELKMLYLESLSDSDDDN